MLNYIYYIYFLYMPFIFLCASKYLAAALVASSVQASFFTVCLLFYRTDLLNMTLWS